MSDQTPVPDATEESEVVAAVATDGVYTLIVADFNDTETAEQAYEALHAVEDGATVEIEGVIVVRKSDDGTIEVQRATDHSTARGLSWGALGGVVLGVIFPPSILASAVGFGVIGAAIGKGQQHHHKKELAEELEMAIEPGHSAIVALVSDPGAVEVEKALAKADKVVQKAIDDATVKDIKAAAKAAEEDVKQS